MRVYIIDCDGVEELHGGTYIYVYMYYLLLFIIIYYYLLLFIIIYYYLLLFIIIYYYLYVCIRS